MKSLACLRVLHKCGIQTPRAFHKFNNHSQIILPRTLSVSFFKHDNFHPYNPSYYYKEESELDVETKRTTYADLEQSAIDNSLAKLLAVGVAQNGATATQSTLTKPASSPSIPYRRSDDFWNNSPWHLASTRSYSTKADKDSNDEKNNTEGETAQSTDDTTDASNNPEADLQNKTKREQLKIIFTQYGAFGVAFHIAMSLCSLGFFYLLVSSGIDVVGLMAKLGIEVSDLLSGASTFVIAYTVHKIVMPVRVSITVVSVPILVRYLRRVGLFKK